MLRHCMRERWLFLEELTRWAAMAGMSLQVYIEACIKKGHQIIGRQVLDTPTFQRTPYKPDRKAR